MSSGTHGGGRGWVDRMGSFKWVPVPSSRTVRILTTVAVLLTVAFLAWLMFQLISLAGEVRTNEGHLSAAAVRVRALEVQNDRQDQALAEANRRLKAAGKPTVATPTNSPAVTGPRGLTGPQGERGAPGSAGAKGNTGAAGATGKTGPTGPQGATGETGAQGPAGANGTNGTSAYPFTFTFTIQLNPNKSTTFTCTLTAPDVVADCTAQENP